MMEYLKLYRCNKAAQEEKPFDLKLPPPLHAIYIDLYIILFVPLFPDDI